MQSLFAAWLLRHSKLFRRRKLLNARAAVTTIDNSDRKLSIKKVLVLAMAKPTAKVDSTEVSGRRTGHSDQSSTVPISTCSLRLLQIILLLL